MNDMEATEFAQAMRSVKRAKNVFLWLILLCILVQGASLVVAGFTELGGKPIIAPDEVPAEAPAATQPASAPAEDGPPEAATWNDLLRWVLPGTKFIAMVSGFLLLAPLWFAGLVALQRQGAGVAGFVSALFWALVLLAMVFPWQQLLRTSLACGALYNFGELAAGLETLRPGAGGFGAHLVFYLRFVGYPLLTVLVWGLVQIKFAGAYSRGMSTGEVRAPKPLGGTAG